MKKRVFGKKLSRGSGARRALYRSLFKALAENNSVVTTKAKAGSVTPFVGKIIKIAKKDTVGSRRMVYAKLGNDRKTTNKVFNDLLPVLSKRSGGYLKITPLPRRKGDNAEMVKMEWVEKVKEKIESTEKKTSNNKKAQGKADKKLTILKRKKSKS